MILGLGTVEDVNSCRMVCQRFNDVVEDTESRVGNAIHAWEIRRLKGENEDFNAVTQPGDVPTLLEAIRVWTTMRRPFADIDTAFLSLEKWMTHLFPEGFPGEISCWNTLASLVTQLQHWHNRAKNFNGIEVQYSRSKGLFDQLGPTLAVKECHIREYHLL